jgi:hypothetical protein
MFNVMKKNKRESATVRERGNFSEDSQALLAVMYIYAGEKLSNACVCIEPTGGRANFHQAKYLITPLSASFAKIPIAEAKYLHTRQQQTSW